MAGFAAWGENNPVIITTHPPAPPRLGKTAVAAFKARRKDLAGVMTINCDATNPRPCTAKYRVSGARNPQVARAKAAEAGLAYVTDPRLGDLCPAHNTNPR